MRFWFVLGCAGIFTAGAGFVAAQHGSVTDARNGVTKPRASLEDIVHPPAEVTRILNQSCTDCHSERTRWPWYSHLPVIGKQLEQHVNAGRLALDLSDWKGHVEASDAEDKLDSICTEARARKMPLPEYLILHPQARLDEDEIETLCKWTASVRTEPQTIRSATDPRFRPSYILK